VEHVAQISARRRTGISGPFTRFDALLLVKRQMGAQFLLEIGGAPRTTEQVSEGVSKHGYASSGFITPVMAFTSSSHFEASAANCFLPRAVSL
jgi:hypothetical protein